VQTFNDPHNVAGGNLLGVWHHEISEDSNFQMTSYYDRTSRLSPQLDEIRNTFDIDFLYHLNWDGRQNLSLGAGARWSADNITQKFATLNFTPQQETDSIYSWFLQDEISIIPRQRC
jgi:iron complex outermembrane recepter protein